MARRTTGTLTVLAWRDTIDLLEDSCKGLVGGKAVVQRNAQQVLAGVADFLQRKSRPPVAQIVLRLHLGDLFELSRDVESGATRLIEQAFRTQRFAAFTLDTHVNLIDDLLRILMPLVHRCRCTGKKTGRHNVSS